MLFSKLIYNLGQIIMLLILLENVNLLQLYLQFLVYIMKFTFITVLLC
jgi:hypothetical protein